MSECFRIFMGLLFQADPNGTGNVRALDAAIFMKKSGLKDQVLSQVSLVQSGMRLYADQIWACTQQMNKMTCVPREDADQPRHLASLIKVFTVRCLGSLGPKTFFRRTAKSLIGLGCWPGLSESSLGMQIILLVLSCFDSFMFECLENLKNLMERLLMRL